ncbi:thioesterase II family protein [Corynebacterium freneyi]|uniref:Thioesterase TesA n=2 Tax=Corynebacterium freneyi TaxID=134034 RepID=A0A095XYW4_9CORY|nr:alpha/beta fold hydrolase [Corynebacterium freneyi]KGF15016.1 hypothetical protein HMPREF1650_12585 [Corynebacterium freneyi DNF00450]MBP2332841.1 surfactin synthase thioesterase subunit [Corynebacterium freneyi]MDK8767244.1 alpha/beta fold hydrolase [Corynebacterium freneyi]QXA53029.1 alpha/beta fold hydrolase [Corynebacterium freneyi]UBI03211.1 alpha/beta fold hydrolase [Corynebacterium freneyi]
MQTQIGSAWLRRFGRAAVRGATPLVICPHAGGGAAAYRPLAAAIEEAAQGAVDVIALQYPGRQDRIADPAPETIGGYADGALAELRSLLCDGPAPILFGHSMGSMVAFELARRLEEEGVAVGRLFVSGAVAPSRVADLPPHPTDDEGMVRHLAALRGTGGDVLGHPDIMRLALPALRADYAAFDRYETAGEAPLAAPISAFGGEDDEHVTPGDLFGWSGHTCGGCDVRLFPGGHFYIDDRVGAVAAAIVGLVRP